MAVPAKSVAQISTIFKQKAPALTLLIITLLSLLHAKSQITIPKGIVSKLELAQRDEGTGSNATLRFASCRLLNIPSDMLTITKKEVAVVGARFNDGTQPSFSGVDEKMNSRNHS